jgi:hypothetical protein
MQSRRLNPIHLALWAALPMAHTSKIEGRINMILNGSRNRRAMTRGAGAVAALLAFGAALMIATAHTPPRSLMAALTTSGYSNDTPTHINANIAFIQAQIRRFSDTDPWAGKAYYGLGNLQREAGQTDAALASFDKAIALPEPPYANSGIHSSARYERINTLDIAGRDAEAAAETEALMTPSERGLVTGDLWMNLRERLPEFKRFADYQANRATEHGLYRGLTAGPRWTQTLSGGVTVQLVGVMRTAGKKHTVWSPEGQMIRRTVYDYGDAAYSNHFMEPTRHFQMILRFAYPTGQAILTEYTFSGASGSGYQSGLARNGGKVLINEDAINPETSGCRLVDAWFPASQTRTDMRVGVAVITPPTGLTDPTDAPKEWAEFPNITLPPGKQAAAKS